MNKIGLFFGSFNPVHIGHLFVARKAIEDTDIDEVWFVVSPANPSKVKSGELEDENHRLNMVTLSIKDDPDFIACDVEFNMPRPSYTADTFKKLRSLHPDKEFYFIAGSDVQRKIYHWGGDGRKILDDHKLIVYPRVLSEKDLKFKLTDRTHEISIYLKDVPSLEISATLIRNSIQKNKSIKHLIPESVIDYIKENDLFKK